MKILETFRNMFDLSNISAIIIDKISTIQAYMLGYIHVRLQEATHNFNAPFGGIALAMIDDFDQLPPVVGSSIPEVAMRMLQKKISGRNCGQSFRKENNEDDVTAVSRRGVEEFLKATH